jgi:hypothetical protein
MTVQDLIQRLKDWDPNAEVRIGRYCGTVDWSIEGISVYVLSPSDEQYCVYLGCEIAHYKGERIQQTNAVEESNFYNGADVKTTEFREGVRSGNEKR